MTGYYSSDDEIERIGRGLAERSLPKAEWTHAAHFAAALWLLSRQPEAGVRIAMPPLIRAYNAATGVQNTDTSGYHETITQASISAAAAVLASQPQARPLHEVLEVLMAGPYGASGWPLAYWTKARLFSVEARRGWVEPDIGPVIP